MLRWGVPVLIVTVLTALVGCASQLKRPQFTEREQAVAEVVDFPGVRSWANSSAARAEAFWPRTGERKITFLALSGGADGGAYGAGLLNGWSATGNRPSFTVVSGVSTGALIAPYAFLGPSYDPSLAALYTRIEPPNLFNLGAILSALAGASPALSDSPALEQLVARIITPDTLARIAEEHRKGRRLLVATTNLDAERTVVWNIGEIADRNAPGSLALIRKIIVASASVPGLFPPVMIEVEANGRRLFEMHADGAITAQFLAIPETLLIGGRVPRRVPPVDLYLVINKKLEPDFDVVEPALRPILERSFSTMTKAHARSLVLNTYGFTRSRGIPFHLSYIGQEFEVPDEEPIDLEYMRALFAYGVARAQRGMIWQNRPPNLQRRIARR